MGVIIMNDKKVIKCEGLVDGVAEGIALVTLDNFSFLGGADVETGEIVELGHSLKGHNLKGKILFFHSGRGSVGASSYLYYMGRRGTAPAGLGMVIPDPPVIIGAILAKIPVVKLSKEQLKQIKTGSKVKIDGSAGEIVILNE